MKVQVGQSVTFVNSVAQEQAALVTNVFGDENPAVNLILLSMNEQKNDSFGRQHEHHGSVVHKSSQPAHGNYWY